MAVVSHSYSSNGHTVDCLLYDRIWYNCYIFILIQVISEISYEFQIKNTII